MDRVRKLIEKKRVEKRLEYKELSEALGRNHAYVQQYISRGVPRNLKDSDLRKLAKLLDVEDEIFGSDTSAPALSETDTVRELDSRAGAGGGGVIDTVDLSDPSGNQISVEVIKDHWRIPSSFLRGELRLDADHAVMIEVSGDSGYDPSNPHAPGSVFPGDRVIVNTADTRPTPPGPFLVYDGSGFVVKLCEPVYGADPPAIRLSSRNSVYSPYTITLDDGHVVVGRVVGRFTRM